MLQYITEWTVIGFVLACGVSLTYYLRYSLRRKARRLFILFYGSIGMMTGVYLWFALGEIPATERALMGRMAIILNFFLLTIIFVALGYINKKHE